MRNARNQALLKRLIKFMRLHVETMKTLKADRELLNAYEGLTDFVESEPDIVLLVSASATEDEYVAKIHGSAVNASMTRQEVLKILDDPDASRKTLEELAVVRFGVPKGSLRQWGSKAGLRDKNLTMLRNEDIHSTIKEVALNSSEKEKR